MHRRILAPRDDRLVSLARASAFAAFADETAPAIRQFVSVIHGLPLTVRKGNDLLYFLNCPTPPGFWGGSREKDALVVHGQREIELWETWTKLGRKLPFWFLELQRARRIGTPPTS